MNSIPIVKQTLKKTTLYVLMPNILILRWLLTGLLVLLPWVARGQVVALDPVIQGQPLGMYLQYLMDSNGRLTLSDAITAPEWQPSSDDIPNFGFRRHVYWFRLDLQAAELQEPWLLEISYNLLDEVQFFLLDGSEHLVSQHTVGMLYPEQGAGRYNRMFLLPLPIERSGVYTAYFRIKSDHALHMPLYLWRSNEYIAHAEQDNIALGLFFGTFFILLLYNFFLYTLAREPTYLVFSGLVLALILFHAQLRSLGLRLLAPEWVQWNGPMVLLSSLLATYMLALHAERFLKLEQTRFPLKKFYGLLRWLCLVTGGLIMWSRTEYGIYLMVSLVSLTSGVTFFAVLYCYRGNDRAMRWFASAWVMFFLGIMALSGSKVAILPYNLLTDHAISVAALVGMLMISMAMSDRNNQQMQRLIETSVLTRQQLDEKIDKASRSLRNEEMQSTAAEISLRLQTENNERLLRDTELREQEIEAVAQRLREVARIDAQTTAFNRNYFNQRLKEEFERAIRSQQRLSLIFVGIRQVEVLEQRYGFKASDEVVRRAAEVVEGVTRHHCASVFRFGDDIFAVILPAVSVHRTQAIAEMIKAAFDDQPFLFAGQMLDVGVSVGVGSLMPDLKMRPETLVASAENALGTACEQVASAIAVNADRVG